MKQRQDIDSEYHFYIAYIEHCSDDIVLQSLFVIFILGMYFDFLDFIYHEVHCVQWFMFDWIGCTAQDTVTQSKPVMTAYEDGTATLDCTYKATSTQYPNLLWYQQKTNGYPKYMLIRLSGSSSNDEEFKERLMQILTHLH